MFDKNIRRYEAESGKTLDDEILLGVVIAGLQDHYDGSCDAEFKSVEQVPLGSW
jgi:6,7-dimethyl-8-ribityllumazine synthase